MHCDMSHSAHHSLGTWLTGCLCQVNLHSCHFHLTLPWMEELVSCTVTESRSESERTNCFSFLPSQWVWNLCNKVKQKNRRLIWVKESTILFDPRWVSLSQPVHQALLISLQPVPCAFHLWFPLRNRTCYKIMGCAFNMLQPMDEQSEDMSHTAISTAWQNHIESIMWLRLSKSKTQISVYIEFLKLN